MRSSPIRGPPAALPADELKAAYEEVEDTYLEQGGPPPQPSGETPVEAAQAILANPAAVTGCSPTAGPG